MNSLFSGFRFFARPRALRYAAFVAASLGLGGCAISGLDAESQFDCKAPRGLSCVSVSQTYKVSKAGALPGQGGDAKDTDRGDRGRGVAEGPDMPPPSKDAGARGARAVEVYNPRRPPDVQFTTPAPVPTAVAAAPGAAARLSPSAFNAPNSGTPLRTPERVLRIWMAPFQDQEGDLHDQRYVYTTVQPGQWTLDAAKAQIKERYQPVRLVNKPDPSPGAQQKSSDSGNKAGAQAAAAFATGAVPGVASKSEEK